MQIDLNQIIEGCKRGDDKSQKILYDNYKAVFFGICRRYLHTYEDAEDVMIEAFVKIYSKVTDYKAEGSFEGWMKRIVVNEALMFLRKNKHFNTELDTNSINISEEPNFDDFEADIDEEKIFEQIEALSPGYKAVLNLYLVEGYKHREIAEMLGISINTSKSQLILAKRRLQELVKKNLGIDITKNFE